MKKSQFFIRSLLNSLCNVTDAIIDAIRRARSSIAFMAFSFTDDPIGDAMRKRFRAGKEIGGLFRETGSGDARLRVRSE